MLFFKWDWKFFEGRDEVFYFIFIYRLFKYILSIYYEFVESIWNDWDELKKNILGRKEGNGL